MKQNPELQQAFTAGMRRLASGVCVVATRHNQVRYGLTATAVCSLSVTPPSLVVCVSRAAGAHAPIAMARTLSINILSNEQQDVADRFSGAAGVRGADRFRDEDWTMNSDSAPVLRGALANFVCEVAQISDCATHSIFICLVRKTIVEDGAPLIYWQSSYRTATGAGPLN